MKADKKSPKAKAETPQTKAAGTGDQPAPEDSSSCAVVAVGASAGGLEAFKEMLENLPSDTGAAFVFIQHLDPKHISILSELLSKATLMPVVQVTDQMEVEQNHVYVIPPDKGMRIAGGKLLLTERGGFGRHMPIDEFFRSLADQEGSRAIGVLLSGNAPDGTLGMKAIKAVGGITIAQDQTARFDAMPRNAVSAGWVDLVLPADRIATEIVRLCRHPYVNGHTAPVAEQPERPDVIEGERFAEIFNLLRGATGVDFTLYKHGTLRRRILRRMALNRFESEEQYVQRLREDRTELKALFHDILISVTGFFRENATFDALRKLVFPAILKDRSAENAVRVWVPGCSTGEEAYSIAICLLEYMRETNQEIPVQIFGTDLSDPALERARAGIYPESISADISPERLRRFFVKVDGQYQIARSVRDLCIFAQQNLTKDPPFSKLDLITCRNVLIYLGPTLQNKVMRFFHYALKPTGFLVLGMSETVGTSAELFAPLDKRLKIYTRRQTSAPVNLDFGAYEEAHGETHARKPNPASAVEVQRRVDQFILSRYSPAGVLIDDEQNILQFHGHTSPYLEHAAGEPILALNRMLRGELTVEFRKVFDRARRKQTAVRGEVVSLAYMDKMHHVRISVTPMSLPGTASNRYLVLFEEFPPEAHRAPAVDVHGGKPTKAAERIHALEEELNSTKQYLESVIEEQQATTEELKSANEEVQSSNEELQSTNEELLTAKEELQSTNEELTTVNEEMHSRNAELSQINNDLNNLLSSVNIPIVMVGNDLHIRRFTPQAERVLNLLPTDVGRPIGDFKPKIDLPNLDQVFLDVIETLRVREREVQDREGRWFSMWVRPYRTADNKIDGAVMVLFDVTERKQAAEARYRRLFEAARDGILIVDGETGEIIDLNPYMAKTFGVSRSASIGVKYWDLDVFRGTDLNTASFTELQETEYLQRSIVATSKTGGRFDVEAIGNIYLEGDKRVIQFNLRDVSERKRGEEVVRRSQEDTHRSQRADAMARLARGISHDFTNLFTAMTGYSELVRRHLPPDNPAAADVEQIRRAVERANRLTRQLLPAGRMQPGEPEVLSLNELIEEMQQAIRAMLPATVDLAIDLHPEIRPVNVDRVQMETVLLNVVLRAREGLRSGSRMRIATSNFAVDAAHAREHPAVPPGEYVVLEVSETAAGPDGQPDSPRFEPFFSSKERSAQGDVALSDIYAAVRQAGGYIWAASELGRGSTFRVFLPQASQPFAAPQPEPREPVPLPDGRGTILLAESDAMVRGLTARVLRECGYTVIEAAGGPEALDRAQQTPIDLLLADLVLPKMSGRELAERLAAVRPQAKVLFLSGQAEETIAEQGAPSNPESFIQKPFRLDILTQRIRAIMNR